jgi:hypothetical protein
MSRTVEEFRAVTTAFQHRLSEMATETSRTPGNQPRGHIASTFFHILLSPRIRNACGLGSTMGFDGSGYFALGLGGRSP